MTTTDIKPVRRGRLAGTGDWRQQYAALRISAEEAAAQIHSGDAVAMPGAASWPYAVDAALTRRLRESGGKIELDGLFTPTDTVLLQPDEPLASFEKDMERLEYGYEMGYNMACARMDDIKRLFD